MRGLYGINLLRMWILTRFPPLSIPPHPTSSFRTLPYSPKLPRPPPTSPKFPQTTPNSPWTPTPQTPLKLPPNSPHLPPKLPPPAPKLPLKLPLKLPRETLPKLLPSFPNPPKSQNSPFHSPHNKVTVNCQKPLFASQDQWPTLDLL